MKTLTLLESHNIAPTIVEYLSAPPDAATLLRLAKLLDVPLASLLRRGEAAYQDAVNAIPLHDDRSLAEWLHEHPSVLERPIVVNEERNCAVVGRPPENVLSLLHDD